MTLCIEDQIKMVLQLGGNGQLSEAADLCNQILKNDSKNAQVLTLLGLLLYQSGQVKEGIASIEKALNIEPTAKLYLDLGKLYLEQNDFKKMEECCNNSIKIDDKNFDAWFNYAISLKLNVKIEESINAYKKVIELNPDTANAYHNLGNIYFNIKNDTQNALNYYKKYLEIDPDNDDAKSCIGALYLKDKNFKEGWKYLEFSENNRNAIFNRNTQALSATKHKPLWEGEDLKGKTIYVYFNSGFGDTIMFARFFPILKEMGAKVLYRPRPGSSKLFENCNFGATIIDEKVLDNELEFDYHIPIMGLPHRLKIHSESQIPFPEVYMTARAEKTEFYKENYFNNNDFKIGIKWQGYENGEKDSRKIKLKSFEKLFNLPKTKFYSLQKDDGIEQLINNPKIIDLGSTFEDFEDTAAAISNLDLVICNDTSVAHLAGALGKKCWVLLPFVQDWRWHNDLSYSPWYKSIAMFKQSSLDDWNGLFDGIYKNLENELK